jgi:hypothetical protein
MMNRFGAVFMLMSSLMCAGGSAAQAQTSVPYTLNVSNDYSAIEIANEISILPSQWLQVEQPLKPTGDSYVAFLRFDRGELRVRVLDAMTSQVLGEDTLTAAGPVLLPDSDQPLRLVVGNVGTFPLDVALTVFRVGARDRQLVAEFRKVVERPLLWLNSVFELPNLAVTVRPCGMVNAFSRGREVVICTEIVADLINRNLHSALDVVVLHEAAHSLLNVWGLPGYANEDVADEFAAVVTREAPVTVEAFARWLEQQNSMNEALVQLFYGDRHTISIQRARNVRAAAADPELIARWDLMLASHYKRAGSTARESTPVNQPTVADSNTPASASGSGGIDAFVSRNVNLRSGPSAMMKSFGVLNVGTAVRLIESEVQSGFYHVQTSSGAVGWVSSRNITIAATPSSTTAANVDTGSSDSTGAVVMGVLLLALVAIGVPMIAADAARKRRTGSGDTPSSQTNTVSANSSEPVRANM